MNLSDKNIFRAIKDAEKTRNYDEVICLALDANGKKWEARIKRSYDHDDSSSNLKLWGEIEASFRDVENILWEVVRNNVPEYSEVPEDFKSPILPPCPYPIENGKWEADPWKREQILKWFNICERNYKQEAVAARWEARKQLALMNCSDRV